MMYQIKQIIQIMVKGYAYMFLSALFILSLCFSLDLLEKGFQHKDLIEIVKYLGLSIVPIAIWSLLYYIFFGKKIDYFIYNSASQNPLKWFGYFSLGATIVSIFKDIHQVQAGEANFIPAGIVRQFTEFTLQLDTWSSDNLSFWLIARYVLILIFTYSFLMSFKQFLQVKIHKPIPYYDPETDAKTAYSKRTSTNISTRTSANTNYNQKSTQTKRKSKNKRKKSSGKKIKFIE